MHQVGENIWTVDGPELVFAGASMHTRMTVVRLHDERLWVHSPIELNEATQSVMTQIGGDVAALVAPNKYHYMFIDAWRSAYPHATVFAEDTVRKKVASLHSAELLTNSTPELYADDIDQVVFGGNRLFQEVVFFHKASRALIFTDLMINLKPDGIKLLPRLFLQFEGVTWPNGGVPRLYRWLTSDRDTARAVLEKMRDWAPEKLLFCHGEPFELSATELLDREFGYLK